MSDLEFDLDFQLAQNGIMNNKSRRSSVINGTVPDVTSSLMSLKDLKPTPSFIEKTDGKVQYNGQTRTRDEEDDTSSSAEQALKDRRLDSDPNDNNESDTDNDDDMISVEDNPPLNNNNAIWQEVKPRRSSPDKKQPRHELPAIKIKLTNVQTKHFIDPIVHAEEIFRCKPTIKPDMIKFTSFKFTTLIIATDDQKTHELLSAPWPSDAFNGGIIQTVANEPKKPIRIVIKGVTTNLNVSSKQATSQLADQKVSSAVRKLNQEGAPTTLIGATTDSKESLRELLKNGVRLGSNKFTVEPAVTILQCFKCQKLGHSAASCPNAQTCVRCGGPHKKENCQATYKCSNCNQAHAACSRACSYLKQASTTTSSKSYANVTARQPLTLSNQPTKQQAKPNEQTSPKTNPASIPAINKEDLIAEIMAKLIPEIHVQVATIHNSFQAETQTYMQQCMSQMTSHFKSLVDANMGKQDPKQEPKTTPATKQHAAPSSLNSMTSQAKQQQPAAVSKKPTNLSFTSKQHHHA